MEAKAFEGRHCSQGSDIRSVRPCRTWRGAGGGGYCSARVLSARFDLPALCTDGPRSSDVRASIQFSNFERCRSRDELFPRTNSYCVWTIVLCFVFYLCVLVFFFGLFDDDCEAKEIMPKSLCDWTLVFICSWVVFFIFVSPFGFAADFFWCHKQREEQW